MKVVKSILKVLLVLAVLLIIALALHPFWLGSAVKGIAKCSVPGITNTGFELDDTGVNLYKGRIGLGGLALRNPEGCSTTNAVSFKTMRVEVAPTTVLSDEIVVREFYLEGFYASYVNYTDSKDKAFSGSNWDWIVKQLEVSEEDEKELEEAGNTKVLIDDLYIKDSKLYVTIPGIGVGTTVPLPDVRLSITKEGIDIKEPINTHISQEGVTIANIGEIIVKIAGEAVTKVVSKVFDGAGELAGAAIGVAGDAANAATEAAGKALTSAKEALGNVDTAAATDAAMGAATAATDAAKDVGGKALDAAGDMAGKAGEALGGAADAAKNMGGAAADAVGGALKSINPFGK